MNLPQRIRTDSPVDRFLSYVEEHDGCWLWDGTLKETGYGQAAYHGKRVSAHRVSFILFSGPITNGLHVLHKCDVRNCVNPAHLMLGTHTDNMHDMIAKGRHVAPRGERAGGAKLTEQEVRAIRMEEGAASRIGARYGVSKSLVHAIRNGRIWRHVQ
jgi:hypothetical protein